MIIKDTSSRKLKDAEREFVSFLDAALYLRTGQHIIVDAWKDAAELGVGDPEAPVILLAYDIDGYGLTVTSCDGQNRVWETSTFVLLSLDTLSEIAQTVLDTYDLKEEYI